MVILGDGNVFPNFENGVKEASSIFLISDPILRRIVEKVYATFTRKY